MACNTWQIYDADRFRAAQAINRLIPPIANETHLVRDCTVSIKQLGIKLGVSPALPGRWLRSLRARRLYTRVNVGRHPCGRCPFFELELDGSTWIGSRWARARLSCTAHVPVKAPFSIAQFGNRFLSIVVAESDTEQLFVMAARAEPLSIESLLQKQKEERDAAAKASPELVQRLVANRRC